MVVILHLVACEQAVLFGRAKRVSRECEGESERERASE